ncbi:MAG: phosphonate C-P lyase system protein PhnG [Sneathiella sp.]|nr:MAG: phosphonate C-P lyase system protein PhnG [Sneathiella sp.]
MGTLARASETDLEEFWDLYGKATEYDFLRPPEFGLVMVQGRAGGNGQKFNLGEMSVTRCSVLLSDGTVGHAYIAGRKRRHAEIAAVFDALLQNQKRHDKLNEMVIAPLADKRARALSDRSRKAAATKVDFFTMVRGEDA